MTSPSHPVYPPAISTTKGQYPCSPHARNSTSQPPAPAGSSPPPTPSASPTTPRESKP
nr:MAG TPA: hypothetical protein [Caudoviricetes sp.]